MNGEYYYKLIQVLISFEYVNIKAIDIIIRSMPNLTKFNKCTEILFNGNLA